MNNVFARKCNANQDSSVVEGLFNFQDANFQLDEKLNEIILNNRSSLWENGAIDDIKAGDYFVQQMEIVGLTDYDSDLFDFIGKYTVGGPERVIGLAKGLEKNILLEIKGKSILVADKHNFVAPFLLETAEKRILPKRFSMDHIDAHHDRGGTLRNSLKDYGSNLSDKDKLKYVLKNSEIGTWQTYPLIKSKIASEESWRWLTLADSLTKIVQKNLQNIVINENPFSSNGADVMDIDIDFLADIDKDLTVSEKAEVLRANIPERICKILSYLASNSENAKVITLITSPAFINQARAIEYVKYFIEVL